VSLKFYSRWEAGCRRPQGSSGGYRWPRMHTWQEFPLQLGTQQEGWEGNRGHQPQDSSSRGDVVVGGPPSLRVNMVDQRCAVSCLGDIDRFCHS
jgi:hypothetical protein